MTGNLNQVNALHLGARCLLHALECVGGLINTPVTLPPNEHRRNIACSVCEQLQLGVVFSRLADAVTVEPVWENTRRGVRAGKDGMVGVYDGFLPCAISFVGHALCHL